MTFCVAGDWLAVPVEQMDRIALADRIWAVPLSQRDHIGLMDDAGELIPVMRLGPSVTVGADDDEQLVAILHVRGETVGLAVDTAGRVHDRFRTISTDDEPPAGLAASGAQCADSDGERFWLIDPDQLWLTPPRTAASPSPTV
ncbi:MAG: chemotaxis protein CheW [Myxococcota bacterium]